MSDIYIVPADTASSNSVLKTEAKIYSKRYTVSAAELKRRKQLEKISRSWVQQLCVKYGMTCKPLPDRPEFTDLIIEGKKVELKNWLKVWVVGPSDYRKLKKRDPDAIFATDQFKIADGITNDIPIYRFHFEESHRLEDEKAFRRFLRQSNIRFTYKK